MADEAGASVARKRFPWALIAPAILVFAILRAFASFQTGHSIYGRQLLHDALEYYNLAARFEGGEWQQKLAFFLGPGWPILLGLWFKLVGVSIGAGRALNVILSFGTMLLIARASWRFGGGRACALGAMMWALYGPAVFHEQTLLMEIGAGFFMTSCAVAALEALLSEHGTRRRMLLVAGAGLLLGVAALFRANALLAAPVLVGVLVWDGRYGRDGRHGRYGRVREVLLAVACGVLPLVPTTVHNWRAERSFAPISTNLGLNLFIGFSERSTGSYFIPASADSESRGLPAARQALGKEDISSSEISRYWSGEAMKFIRANPGRAATLVLRRAAMLANAREFPQIYYPERMSPELPFLSLPLVGYALVFPFAAMGSVLLLRRRELPAAIWVLVTLALVASLLPFFVTGRYRLPLAPFMIVLAACGIAGWIEAFKRGEKSTLKLPGAAFAIAAVLCWGSWPWSRIDPVIDYRFDEIRSALYLRDGDSAKAEELLRAIPEDMAGPTALNRLGKIAEDSRQDYCGAATLYLRAAQDRPFVPQYWFNAGQARLRCSQSMPAGPQRNAAFAEARQSFERALSLDPDLPETAWINLAGLCQATGDLKGARTALREFLRRHPGHPVATKRLADIDALDPIGAATGR